MEFEIGGKRAMSDPSATARDLRRVTSTSAVVADTKTHAQALISWLRLDPNVWKQISYGQPLNGTRFESAKIVRPLSGVVLAHIVWLETEFLPLVAGRKWSVPHSWCPDEDVDVFPQDQGYASMWDRR